MGSINSGDVSGMAKEVIHHPDRIMLAVPFNYGWIILGTAALGAFMTTPGQTGAVAAFFDPIIADLGITRDAAAFAYALGTLLGILPSPIIGRWIDRFGVRPAAAVISGALVAACFAMAFVWTVPALALAFALLRGAAVGGLLLLSQHVVNLWFVQRRGVAVSAALIGTALGGMLFPPVIDSLVSAHGWRVAYVELGVIVGVTILPLAILLLRDAPERFGLRPDFNAAPADAVEQSPEPRINAREAMRGSIFWILAAAGFLSNMIGTALLLHHVSVLEAGGVGRYVAIIVLSPLAAAQAIATLLAGYLIDRFGAFRMLPGALTLLGLASLAALTVTSTALAWTYAIALGVALGSLNTIQAAGYAQAFGRSNMGEIRGASFVIAIGGAALGPLPLVWSLSGSGGYQLAILAFAVVAGIVALAAGWVARNASH